MAYLPSYKSCGELMATARSPGRGKPVCSGTRLFEESDAAYRVDYQGTVAMRYYPDNTVTLHRGEYADCGWTALIWRVAGVMAGSAGRRGETWIGKDWRDRRWDQEKGRYVLKPDAFPGALFFDGIRVDLTTKKPVADQERPLLTRSSIVVGDKDVDAEWRKQVREYGRLWRATARIGAFDHLLDKPSWQDRWQMRHGLSADLLARVVRDKSFDDADVRLILAYGGALNNWSPKPPQDAFAPTYKAFRRNIRQQIGASKVVNREIDPLKVAA
jgi:hypothetical protein